MVAMNPQTWDADVKEDHPGGYLFYDSTKPLAKSKFRDDINVVGLPLTRSSIRLIPTRASGSCSRTISTSVRSRRCSRRPAGDAELIGEQYKGKERS